MDDPKAATKRRFSPYLSLAALGLAVLLVTFPVEIIRTNAEEIQAPGAYLVYFILWFVMLTAAFVVVSLFLPERAVKFIAIALASYAISIIIVDYLFPLNIGPLETGSERPEASLESQLWQFGIFAASVGLLCILPQGIIGGAAGAFAAVLVVTGALTAFFVLPSQETSIRAEAAPNTSAPGAFNIYQIVFDTYYGPWFEFARHELGINDKAFDGFTHYIDAKSNYWNTEASFPSFLTGSIYAPPMKVSDWERRAHRDSLITDLNALGYHTSAYALFRRHGMQGATKFKNEISGSADFPLVVDFVLLRTAPPLVRPAMLRDGRGPASMAAEFIFNRPTGDLRVYHSYQQFLDFLAEEPERPASGQYALFHSYPPHPPYMLDRNGNLRNTNYDEQLLLATRMMKQFIDVLKATDKYDSSLIILMSDHGYTGAASLGYREQRLRYFLRITSTMSREIAEVDLRGMTGRRLEARFSPLLLIKPPVGCGDIQSPLRVREGLVQLKDLRRFINAIVKNPTTACEYPAARSVVLSHGLVPLLEDGRLTPVPELRNRRISRYLINDRFRWRILEDIEFEY